MTVAPALPLPEPVIPAVPPGLENLTTSSGEKLFPTIDVEPPPPLLFDEQNNGSQLQFQIPTAAFVSREPPAIVWLTRKYFVDEVLFFWFLFVFSQVILCMCLL